MKTDFLKTRDLFYIPDGTIYLNGNSLGPLPKTTEKVMKEFLKNEWGKELVKGWNTKGWFSQPALIGNQIANLIGAPKNSVIVGDTLSSQVFQALTCAIRLNQNRKIILTDSGNFPADIYIAEGLLKFFGNEYELKIVDPEEIEHSINEDIAVLMLTEVDYRTGRLHNMSELTEKAHDCGVITLWDLAHTAGAIPINLKETKADFAVGCTYKYLNGGPGSPAFIYISPSHIKKVEPALLGWHGHESPFEFNLHYKASELIEKMRVGTPSIIAFASLSNALDIWKKVNLNDLRVQSIKLSEIFIKELDERCPQIKLISPRNSNLRGSQVSYEFDFGYECMQSLIEHKLIGDFRAPNIMRFGFAPLFNNEDDIYKAIDIIGKVLSKSLWKKFKNKRRSVVT